MPALSGVIRPSAVIAMCSVTTNPAPPDAALRICCIYSSPGIPFCAAQVESGDKTTRLGRVMLRNLKGVNKGGGATTDPSPSLRSGLGDQVSKLIDLVRQYRGLTQYFQ